MLDKLDPAERLAFVLHDMFAMPFDEIAPIVDRSPRPRASSRAAPAVACRARPRRRSISPTQRRVVDAFLAALRAGDFEALVAVLGGNHEWASGAIAFRRSTEHMRSIMVDGRVGLALAPGGKIARVLIFTFDGATIRDAEIVTEADALAELADRGSSEPLTILFARPSHSRAGFRHPAERAARERAQRRKPMKISLTSVYVDDQEKALRFYTEVLGFTKKADFSQGPFRWLTVVSPEQPDGTELQLALNDNPAAKAYQQAIFQQGQPALMLFTDDLAADYERMKARGADFTMPPTDVTASKIAKVNDGCGNLVQISQLARW